MAERAGGCPQFVTSELLVKQSRQSDTPLARDQQLEAIKSHASAPVRGINGLLMCARGVWVQVASRRVCEQNGDGMITKKGSPILVIVI